PPTRATSHLENPFRMAVLGYRPQCGGYACERVDGIALIVGGSDLVVVDALTGHFCDALGSTASQSSSAGRSAPAQSDQKRLAHRTCHPEPFAALRINSAKGLTVRFFASLRMTVI